MQIETQAQACRGDDVRNLKKPIVSLAQETLPLDKRPLMNNLHDDDCAKSLRGFNNATFSVFLCPVEHAEEYYKNTEL